MSTLINPLVIFDFNNQTRLSRWMVVDDTVMGGVSDGNLFINKEGLGVYQGTVSLENNGGFSSIRYRMDVIDISAYSHLVLHIKGDGKEYQTRLKSSIGDWHSYKAVFETSGKWEKIKLPLADMRPVFRGSYLNIGNYAGEQLAEVGILISNKQNESFQLLIDEITLE